MHISGTSKDWEGKLPPRTAVASRLPRDDWVLAMNMISRGPAESVSRLRSGRLPGVRERNEALASVACQSLRDLGASSITVYLRADATSTLNAAVVAVSPLGVTTLDKVAIDDDIYASAAAYQSGEVTTRHSIDILGKHPELAVSASFPFTVSAAPLRSATRRFGAIMAYWPETFRALAEGERTYLRQLAETVSRRLDAFADEGVSIESGPVPLVVPSEAGTDASAFLTAPLVYQLHKLAVLLTSAKHTREVADLALERVIPVFDAQAMALSLIEADRLRVVGASGCSRGFLRTLDGLSLNTPAPETEAIASKRQLVYSAAPEQAQARLQGANRPAGDSDDDYIWVVLPLVTSGHAVGSCSLAFTASSPVTTAGQAVLTALATLLGQAFERTQMYDAQYALAEKLQQVLLPRMLPQPPGVVATSRYVPATGGIELGGDWYDLIHLPDGTVAAVVGDVQGHDTTATVVMGQLRSAVRAYAIEGHDPATVLSRTNSLLLGLETSLFATCCCVWLDPAHGIGYIATAGNPAPLIRTPDGRSVTVDLDVGIPLGVEVNPDYQATKVVLAPGALIALYTDGLADPEDYAAHAPEAAIGASDAELETLGDQIVDAAGRSHAYRDDAALLLMRYEGAPDTTRPSVRQLDIQRHDLPGVGRARVRLREWLCLWDLADMADAAELLASEVVTNALVHGDSDVNVCVRKYADRLRVEVRDSDPHHLARPVSLPRAEDQAEGGRGLLIVSALASSWGNSPSGRGKTVWFELPYAVDHVSA